MKVVDHYLNFDLLFDDDDEDEEELELELDCDEQDDKLDVH